MKNREIYKQLLDLADALNENNLCKISQVVEEASNMLDDAMIFIENQPGFVPDDDEE